MALPKTSTPRLRILPRLGSLVTSLSPVSSMGMGGVLPQAARRPRGYRSISPLSMPRLVPGTPNLSLVVSRMTVPRIDTLPGSVNTPFFTRSSSRKLSGRWASIVSKTSSMTVPAISLTSSASLVRISFNREITIIRSLTDLLIRPHRLSRLYFPLRSLLGRPRHRYQFKGRGSCSRVFPLYRSRQHR